MLAWLRAHHDVLSLLLNAAMLVVWLVYLQLFLKSYLRQKRPKILITLGGGFGLDARCLISNMSDDAIYVGSIIASLDGQGSSWSGSVTDVRDLPDEESARDPKQRTKQGPLHAGDYMDGGSFGDLIDGVRPEGGPVPWSGDGGRLTITVIAVYAAEDLPIAARRRFIVTSDDDGGVRVREEDLDTEQVRTRRRRKKLKEDLRRGRLSPQ